MPFCRNCSHQYQGVAKFCPECGPSQAPNAAAPEQAPAIGETEAETTLWEGESQDLTNAVSGGRVVTSRYRVTTRNLYFDAGLVTTTSEQIPLWAVRDIDMKQYLVQKLRGLGDVEVHVEHSDYTGRDTVLLRDIQSPASVRDLLNQHAQRERLAYQQRQQTRYYGR